MQECLLKLMYSATCLCIWMALDVSILGLEGSQFYLCVCVCVHVLEKAHFLCRVSDLGDNIGASSLCKLDRS